MRHFDYTDGTSLLYRERRSRRVVWIVESIRGNYSNWVWDEDLRPQAIAQMLARREYSG
jgi:hypothetical protein